MIKDYPIATNFFRATIHERTQGSFCQQLDAKGRSIVKSVFTRTTNRKWGKVGSSNWLGGSILSLALSTTLLGACNTPFDVTARVEPGELQADNSQAFSISMRVNAEELASAAVVATKAVPTATPINTNTPLPMLLPPTATPQPTVTPVPTPIGPALTARVALNVRKGPSTAEETIGGLAVNSMVQIVGVNPERSWWYIAYPAGSDTYGWVSADPALVHVYNTDNVAVVDITPAVTAGPTAIPKLLVHSNVYGENDLFTLEFPGALLRDILYSPSDDDSLASVSPDGKRVAFISDRDGNREIYLVNLDGTGLRRLTFTPAPELWPSWSADGKWLAFDSERDGNREIYTLEIASGNTIRVTNNLAVDGGPAWSSDGQRLVFHSDRDGNHEIYTMDRAGGNLTRLTYDTADDWAPAWSPNGGWIAFMSYRNGSAEIYRMSTAGGDPVNLTNNPAEDAVPAWSPDGSQIAFESSRDGNLEVYVMNYDGSGLIRLTYLPNRNEGRPVWIGE
jgi:Tol biopolymer transport system component